MKQMQTNVLDRMAFKHLRVRLLQKAFRGIIMHTQSCLIERLERAKGDEIFKIRMYRKYFTTWKQEIENNYMENFKLEEIKQKLDYKKKLVLMRKWKESVLSNQVNRAQTYTAAYVYKKRLLKKSLEALRLHTSVEKFMKLRWNQAVQFERIKLLTTGFKIMHWYKNKKKSLHQMNLRIDAAYCKLAKKRGFRLFINNTRILHKENQLKECAQKFYDHRINQKYYEIIKNFSMLQKGLKDQEFCIVNYYQERMIMRVFTALKTYTKDKKEYRTNALIFKHRGYQRKLVYLWKVVSFKLVY